MLAALCIHCCCHWHVFAGTLLTVQHTLSFNTQDLKHGRRLQAASFAVLQPTQELPAGMQGWSLVDVMPKTRHLLQSAAREPSSGFYSSNVRRRVLAEDNQVPRLHCTIVTRQRTGPSSNCGCRSPCIILCADLVYFILRCKQEVSNHVACRWWAACWCTSRAKMRHGTARQSLPSLPACATSGVQTCGKAC